jgi:small conductance mechanosensitive channel
MNKNFKSKFDKIKNFKTKFELKKLFSKQYMKNIFIISLILIIGHFFASITSKIVVHITNPSKIGKKEPQAIAYSIIGVTVYIIIMFIIVMVIPSLLGIEITAIVAISGTILLAIGLGLQGTLGDIAAGVMLLLAGTIKIGDYINIPSIDLTGTVTTFSILYTQIKDENSGTTVIVPNKILYNSVIGNPSFTSKVNVVSKLLISNKNKDISNIIKALIHNVQNYPGVYSNPKTTCNVSSVSALGTELGIRYSISFEDYKVKDNVSFQGGVYTLMRQTIIDQGGKLVDFNPIPPI